MNQPPAVLTLPETAAYLRLSASTIYRLLKWRQLPALKIGHSWRFNRDQLDRWRFEQPGAASPSGHRSRP